ncbi:CaiB/BaiF CoA transferase family protein [Candidatus Poriferisocius sp.]|uniref:CaiB/BaiF CoA transferase family protein n=1 Tax=Candidatus Poriferisocius sp. TaxID=3101276 RepID=UPI003B01ECF0
MTGPMDGVKVVELGVWVAGPAAGGILSDWGADVVKIEPPAGDPARTFQRMLGGDMPTNPVFELDNRSKRSIVVDLAQADGQAIAAEIIDDADVFLTNLRLSALDRLGLDYQSLAARNPGLIYCAITGYGLEGPDADRPAYDIAAFWARSGIAAQLTPPGGALPFQRGGMGDHNVGLAGAAAISAALYHRERTGEGQMVSSSLFREGMYTIGFDINVLLMWGLNMAVGTREAMGNPAINNYTAGDGRRFWVVGLEGDRHWPPLARAVGHPEWIEDERFATPRDRVVNAVELIAALDEAFAARPLEEWAEIFATEPDMFWAPVNTLDDLLADPQTGPSGALVEVPDGATGTTMLATPVDFHGTPWAPRSLAPELGEHTDEVLAAMGRTPHQIAELRSSGTVA